MFEDYHLTSLMKRIPSKLIHSADKLNTQHSALQRHQQQVDPMSDYFINPDKIISKYQTVSARLKSPKLRPAVPIRSYSLYDTINGDNNKDNVLSPLTMLN